jgi:hypothetical protein
MRMFYAPFLLASIGCSSQPSPDVGAPSPALRAALADTAAATRVYFANEVPRPAVPAQGNNPPATVGAPDAEARVRLIVGTDGRMERATLEVQAGSQVELARQLAAVLPSWRLLPAERPDRTRVRQLIEVSVRKRGNGMIIDAAAVPRK